MAFPPHLSRRVFVKYTGTFQEFDTDQRPVPVLHQPIVNTGHLGKVDGEAILGSAVAKYVSV